ncbi:MAG: SpoIIE family protein phosphatase [Planctomycetaceae bacterium]|nr:SpoIIE family protein phosphatase [Planctomycetaceae bacterium]
MSEPLDGIQATSDPEIARNSETTPQPGRGATAADEATVQLHQQLEDSRRQLRATMALVEITSELAGMVNLDRILRTVTRQVCKALDCERASLYLYDEESQELYTRVVTELEIEEIRSSIASGITGWVARHRMVASIPDPPADSRWNSTIDLRTGFQTRNILAAPLISTHDDRLVGVLQLLNRRGRSFDDFDQQLLLAFASHAATALERSRLMEESRRSHELELAVELGHRIQKGFLPETLPQIPGYELAAWWEPADAVSGDYYDVIPLPDGSTGLAIADVSGHGVGPSLIMASAHSMLHAVSRTSSEPGRILNLVSELVTPGLVEGRFITFLFASLDVEQHRLTFANAGHSPAMKLVRRTGLFVDLEATGLPVGVEEIPTLPEGTPVEMEEGDLLLLATDGLVELQNAAGEPFGVQRLRQLLLEHQALPAGQILDRLQRAIRGFFPQRNLPDDITVLLLERKKSQSVPLRISG